eukprot:186144_1
MDDNRNIAFRSYNYDSSNSQQKIVIYFPGAGFGRTHAPFTSSSDAELLLQYNIGFIVLERPGYGQSTQMTDERRTYRQYAQDIQFICTKHFEFTKRVYFMAHSAGCPHLLAVAAFYPSLIAKCAIVCPPNPCHGNAPMDRPIEPDCTRSIQRCCLLHCFCCLLCFAKPLIRKWESDSKAFMDFSKENVAALPIEKQFLDEHPGFVQQQQKDFDYAVCKAKDDGGKAMLQDMFILNAREWGFKIRDIDVNAVYVWYGTKDVAAPNGKWYCETLKNSVERRLDEFGHAAVYLKNNDILLDLISEIE